MSIREKNSFQKLPWLQDDGKTWPQNFGESSFHSLFYVWGQNIFLDAAMNERKLNREIPKKLKF